MDTRKSALQCSRTYFDMWMLGVDNKQPDTEENISSGHEVLGKNVKHTCKRKKKQHLSNGRSGTYKSLVNGIRKREGVVIDQKMRYWGEFRTPVATGKLRGARKGETENKWQTVLQHGWK